LTLWQIEKAEQEEILLRLWAELPFSEAPIVVISSKSLSKSPSKSPSKLRSKSPSKSPSKRPSAETEPLKQVHFSLSTTIDLLYPSEPSELSNIPSNPTKLYQSKPQNRNKRKVVQPEGKSTSDKVEIRTLRGRVIKKTEKARGI
jgi:hypothetical protein